MLDLQNIHFAIPEMILLATVAIVLITELFRKKNQGMFVLVGAVLGLIASGVVSYLFLGQYEKTILGGLYISDDLANLMKCFITLSVALAFIYAKPYLEEKSLPLGDFYILGLLSTLGMMSLVSSHSLISIYLSLELLTLPLYAMTALARHDSDGTEAAIKYFVMGAIASGMLLFGMSLVFGVTGNMDILQIKQVLMGVSTDQNLILFGMVFVIAGIGFKLAAVPFHLWLPDVYQGAPVSTVLFLSGAPKIAGMGMAIRLLMVVFGGLTVIWQPLIMVMGLLSVIIGNFLALAQTNLRRLLAYSTIAHMGYAMFGLLAGTTAGYSAATFYVLVYSIMTVAAFALIGFMSTKGIEIHDMDDLKGLNKRSPWLAFMLMIVIFSMAGIPPTAGFFTKLLVLKALVDAHWLMTAVVGLLVAVVGAFYYLRLIKIMYFDTPISSEPISISRFNECLFSINCLALLYLGIFPSALIERCYSLFT